MDGTESLENYNFSVKNGIRVINFTEENQSSR